MKDTSSTHLDRLRERRSAPLTTPTDLDAGAANAIGGAMNRVLADVFALYLKTKNFHWHVSGLAFSRLSPAPRRAGRKIRSSR